MLDKKFNCDLARLCTGIFLSVLLIACSGEGSSNSSDSNTTTTTNDGTTAQTDSDSNVSEVSCGGGAEVFIDGVNVCPDN